MRSDRGKEEKMRRRKEEGKRRKEEGRRKEGRKEEYTFIWAR